MLIRVFAFVLAAAAPTVASAQVAAGSVPNTFDRPAAQQAAPSPASQPANPASEATLRQIIAQAQGEGFDYALMTDRVAEQLRAQEATLRPLMREFGPLQSLDFFNSRDGADIFAARFAGAQTLWIIGFDDDGKVDALLFRPAPSESQSPDPESNPAPAAADASDPDA